MCFLVELFFLVDFYMKWPLILRWTTGQILFASFVYILKSCNFFSLVSFFLHLPGLSPWDSCIFILVSLSYSMPTFCMLETKNVWEDFGLRKRKSFKFCEVPRISVLFLKWFDNQEWGIFEHIWNFDALFMTN